MASSQSLSIIHWRMLLSPWPASITHLTFDRRLPLAREIAAYQKHRVKRIRRSSSGSPSGPSH